MSEYTAEKHCCHPCDSKKLCHICGTATLYACSDCRIDFGVTIYVCPTSNCRDGHEEKCSARLRTKLAEAGKYREMIQDEADQFANRLLKQGERIRDLEAEVTGLRGALDPFIPPDAPPQSSDEHVRLEGADAFGRLYAYLESIDHIHTRYGIVYASAIYDLIENARKALAAPATADIDAYMPAPPRPSGSIEVRLEHAERAPAPVEVPSLGERLLDRNYARAGLLPETDHDHAEHGGKERERG